jgi:hypothetical protein
MFAQPVAKPVTKTASSSSDKSVPRHAAPLNQYHGDAGPAPVFRGLLQGVASAADGTTEHDASTTRIGARSSSPSRNFSDVPVYSPCCDMPSQMPSAFLAPHLPIQAKLEVSAVNDPLEHEADSVADQVMRIPAAEVATNRTPSRVNDKADAREEGETLQKKEAGPQPAVSEAPAIVHQVLHAPGQPLDDATQAYFEPRFGHDFSQVRIHTGGAAEQSARDVSAQAYTVGTNIVFGAGRFAPRTTEGQRLIAHELAHVVQQRSACRAAGSALLQKKPLGERSGPRSVTVQVHWTEDSDQFYSRVLAALVHDESFRDVPVDQFNAVSSREPQSLMRLVTEFHESYSMNHSDRHEGQKLKVHFSADYNSNPGVWGSRLKAKRLSLVEEHVAAQAAMAEPSAGRADSGATHWLSHLAAEADHDGWAGLTFMVRSNRRIPVVTSVEKVGPQTGRPQGMAELSERAASVELDAFMTHVTDSKDEWQGRFGRDSGTGAMHFMGWIKRPPGPRHLQSPVSGPPHRQLSQAEQFERETGAIYPQRWNQKLHDVGALALEEANPISLKNLPYTIAGIVVPMGAMKLLMMDKNEIGALIRIEWQLDKDVIETATARQAQVPPEPTAPLRDLEVGDIIEVPDHGQQRVLEVGKGKIVTEPYTEPPRAQTAEVAAQPQAPGTDNSAIKPVPGHSAKDVLSNYPAKTHVFEGDADGGYHSKARQQSSRATQLKLRKEPNALGVYEIKVEIRDTDGSLLKTKNSTMFPDELSEDKALDEVHAVMLDKHKTEPLPPPNSKGIVEIEGVSPRGYNIRIVLRSNGEAQVLITFHPIR